ncbi:MAG TPA: hypothetical protein VEL07_09305 [Planctomycetota bacterium]|nr:hypothetical protein [Planctomycetota bacterium]
MSRRSSILAVPLLPLVLIAGCGGRTEVAPSASFDPQEVVRVAVLVDQVQDTSGTRSPDVEAEISAVFTRALLSKNYELATAKIDQRDAQGINYLGSAARISDAAALRFAGSAGASHALVITMTADPRPRSEAEVRKPAAVSARLLDARMRSAVWSATHAEPSYVITPFDPRDAVREVAAKVADAIPKR